MFDYASRTTDLCSKAYPAYTSKALLNKAFDCFISCISNKLTQTSFRREIVRRLNALKEAVRMAQASEVPLMLGMQLHAAATGNYPYAPKSSPIAKSVDISVSGNKRAKSSKYAAARIATPYAGLSTGRKQRSPKLEKSFI